MREHLASATLQSAVTPERRDLAQGIGDAALTTAPTVLFLLVPLVAYAPAR